MTKKMMTFEISLSGQISRVDDVIVALDPFWEERMDKGSELAVVKTPAIPEEEELNAELMNAAVLADMSSSMTLDPDNGIHAFIIKLFSCSGEISHREYYRLLDKATLEALSARVFVHKALTSFKVSGKRYACTAFDSNLYLAEVDPGMLVLKIDRKGKITREMDPAKPNRFAVGPYVTNTLLGRRYPGIKLAQVKLPKRLGKSQQDTVRNSAMSITWDGQPYRLALATGSLKNGELVAVEEKYGRDLNRRFDATPEVALGYGGIVANECRLGLSTFEATVRVVAQGDLGTNDSRGWVDESVFAQLGALHSGRFYQFRMDFEASEATLVSGGPADGLTAVPVNAKGCFKVMRNEVAAHPEVAANIVIPDSCIKPGRKNLIGKTFRCTVNLGVMKESEDGVCYGSQSVAVHVPWDVLSTEVFDDAVEMVKKVSKGFDVEGHAEVLKQIGADNKSDTDYYRMVEALLKADGQGGMLRHPYVHQGIRKLLAKWLRKIISGGIEMSMRALADDGFLVVDTQGRLHSGSDWMPLRGVLTDLNDSKRSLTVRFPVRMREDLLPVEHINREQAATLLCEAFPDMPRQAAEQAVANELFLKFTHVMHGQYAKVFGGDFDFDLVYSIPESRYPRLVEWRFGYIPAERTQPVKNKSKKRSPWHEFGVVAMSAMSNHVGEITNSIMSAIAAGKIEEAYLLAPELQEEVSGLKHDSAADMKVVRKSKERIGQQAHWIKVLAKEEISSFDKLPTSVKMLSNDDVVARFYNKMYPVIRDLIGSPQTLANYRGLFDGRYGDRPMTRESLREAGVVNQFFTSQMGRTSKYEAEAQEALSAAMKAQSDLRKQQKWEEAEELEEKITDLQSQCEQRSMDVRQARSLYRDIVCGWAKGKAEEDRTYWAAVLNSVLARRAENAIRNGDLKPKGTGAVLFHAFPREVIEAVAHATYSKPVPVEEWSKDWFVRFNADKLQIVKVECGEDGTPQEALMYQGVKVERESKSGHKFQDVDWQRKVGFGFLDCEAGMVA